MLRIYRNDRNQIFLHRYSLTRCLVSTSKNLYEVLGVQSSATKADIKKAYIEKAKQCHPDLFPDNEEKTKEFQNLQEAYSILSDTQKRAEYARVVRVQQTNSQPGSPPRHPFSDHYNMPPRHNPYGNRFGGTGKSDPLHEMLQEMMRQQYKHRTYEQDRPKGVRWDRIITRFVFVYIVAVIIVANIRLERKERERRISEHRTDVNIQREVQDMMIKYNERARMRKMQTSELRSKLNGENPSPDHSHHSHHSKDDKT